MRLTVVAIVGMLLLMAPVWSFGAAQAQRITLTVTKTADSDDGVCDADCSLREAIAAASNGDTIDIPAGVYPLTLGTELAIDKDLTLTGAGAAATTGAAATATIILAMSSRVFDITGGAVAISGVTIQGWFKDGVRQIAGGIRNSGTLTITDTGFRDALADGDGGAIWNSGTLTITGSAIFSNKANGAGAAIWNSGTLAITNSTIISNTAASNGGGIYNGSGTVSLTNVTIVGNTASGGSGGGVYNGTGTMDLVNTLLAKNGAATGPECAGALTSLGHNLIENGGGCGFTAAAGDLVGPGGIIKLGVWVCCFADNGGPTPTVALRPSSPAINAGDDSAAPATDQRGVARPQDGASDIGAFEFVPGPPDPPANVVALPGDGRVTVRWRAYSPQIAVEDGGSPITGFTVTSEPGGLTAVADASALTATVTGLANGVTYTFTVTATNVAGTSAPSAPSNAVTLPFPLPLGESFEISGVSGGDAIQGKPAIASDGTNFFIVWRDQRDFATNRYDIYGARVAPDGTVLDPSGIPISTFANFDPTPGNQYFPSVAFDGTNYLVVWTANRNPGTVDYEVYAARVTPGGTVLDDPPLQLTTGANPLRMSSIVFDGTNYFVTWRNSSSQIRGARITTGGVNLDGPTSFFVGNGFYPYAAYDGTNYMVVWHNVGGGGLDVFGARVATDGTVLDPGGFPISAAADAQQHASIAFGSTNYLVVWNDERGKTTGVFPRGHVYGARIALDGTVLDTQSFKIGERAVGGQVVGVAFDGTDYLVAWSKDNFEPYFRNADVYVRRVSTDGSILDGQGIPIATSHGHQWGPVVGLDTDRMLIAWGHGLGTVCPAGCVYGHVLQLDTLPAPTPSPAAVAPPPGGWTAQASVTSLGLYSLWAFAEANAYAAGMNGVLVRYDGINWAFETTLTPSSGYDLWGIGSNDLWIMGFAWHLLHWDGQSLTEAVGDLAENGAGVWGTDAGDILIVGASGRAIHHSATADWWDWTELPTGVPVDLSDIWGTSINNVYAVGEYGTIIRYDGAVWSQEENIPTIQRLNGIWGISANDMFAVGDFGTILHYDGTSWSAQESGTTEHLFGVWGSDSSNVYAVGHNGTILRYDGSAWNAEESGTTRDLFAIGGAGYRVWAAGDNGTILRKSAADLVLTKSVSAGPAAGGYDLSYTLAVANNGPDEAMRVILTDTLPGPTAFVSATSDQGSCGESDGTVTCNLANLVRGASATVTIVVTIDPSTPEGTVLMNTANVAITEPDPNATNNFAISEIAVAACGDLNGDGVVNVFDAIIGLQIIVGLVEPTAAQLKLSDVVRDGNVDVFDAILTLQHIVGLTQISGCGPV